MPFGCSGSIPARAGEPYWLDFSFAAKWVYPRACGGTVSQDVVRQDTCGLSPRVRGNRIGSYREISRPGSIPARAGEPRYSDIVLGHERVYPRACGGTTSTLPT